MSISSVLKPVVYAPTTTLAQGAAGGLSAPQGTTPVASINDAFAGSTNTAPATPSSSSLLAPRTSPLLARASKSAGVPALSADDYLDLQQSVALLSQSAEGLSAIRAGQHKVTMDIIRNMG